MLHGERLRVCRIVCGRATSSGGEDVIRRVHMHRLRHRCARARSEWRLEVLVAWDPQLLDHRTVRSCVEVIHRHRHKRRCGQHERLCHLGAAVPVPMRCGYGALAREWRVHGCAIARAAKRKAANPCRLAERWISACDTATCTSARRHHRHAQIDSMVAFEVDLSKEPVQPVQRRVVGYIR